LSEKDLKKERLGLVGLEGSVGWDGLEGSVGLTLKECLRFEDDADSISFKLPLPNVSIVKPPASLPSSPLTSILPLIQ
jgi:hypothetical protein